MDETETDKNPRTILFRNFLIQITIIVFFIGTWLSPLLIAFVEFNIGYFIFMLVSIFISSIIILRSKIIPEQPIPISVSQKFANLLKTMTDVIITDVIGNEHPQVKDIKDIIQKVIIWNIRDGKITPEFDLKIIGEAETYILDKFFPKKEIEQES